MYVHLSIYMCVCIYIHIYIYIHVYTHICIHRYKYITYSPLSPSLSGIVLRPLESRFDQIEHTSFVYSVVHTGIYIIVHDMYMYIYRERKRARGIDRYHILIPLPLSLWYHFQAIGIAIGPNRTHGTVACLHLSEEVRT